MGSLDNKIAKVIEKLPNLSPGSLPLLTWKSGWKLSKSSAQLYP